MYTGWEVLQFKSILSIKHRESFLKNAIKEEI